MSSELVLFRHGETEWSAVGRYAGHTDLALTEQGVASTIAAREKLTGIRFERVVASPLVRARHTAELLSSRPVVTDARLVERNYGDYEGLTTQQIRTTVPGWQVWSDPIPNGETLQAMVSRVDSFIHDARDWGSGTSLVVAHAHVIRLLTARWLGLEAVLARHFRIGTLGLVHLGWERETPALLKWNA